MGLRLRVGLVAALVLPGGLMAGVATAASKPKTSVSLQFARHGGFKGKVTSSRASCVRSRVVRLEKRKGHRWVSVATAKSNHAGHFQGTVHSGAGQYRAVAAANGSCASGASKTV